MLRSGQTPTRHDEGPRTSVLCLPRARALRRWQGVGLVRRSLLIALVSLAFAGVFATPASATAYTISGQVTDAVSGAGIGGNIGFLYIQNDCNGNGRYLATLDASG